MSAIAYHHQHRMVLRSVIFSTPKSGKIIHNWIQIAHLHTAHLNILRSAICSTAGLFKTQGLRNIDYSYTSICACLLL